MQKKPDGYKPETAMIKETDIAATVELDKAWTMKLASENYVKTLGFKISVSWTAGIGGCREDIGIPAVHGG